MQQLLVTVASFLRTHSKDSSNRRSHVSFCLYFERHVKYAGRARVNYSSGLHCHLEFEIGDYRIFWLKNVFAQAQSGAKVFI